MNSYCWCCPDCLSVSSSHKTRNAASPCEDFEGVYEFQVNHPLFHLTKALQYHPSYLQSFLEAHSYFLHENGPLTIEQRIYIGIMAVSRHQCTYLLNLLCHEFTLRQGNRKWLQGLEHAPAKLRSLNEINKLLAHRPWLLTPAHILKVARGGKENWSISELTQAIVLLVFHHCLVSLVTSCGIGIEHSVASPTNIVAANFNRDPHLQQSTSEVYGIDILLERMKLVETEVDDFTPEERLERFKDIERQSVNLLNAEKSRKCGGTTAQLFTSDLDFAYEDFATQMSMIGDLQPYPVQDYSWETHGYLVANMYYIDSAPLLDNKFKIAKSLTYNTVGTYPNVDTRTFRTAIWNYTQCMLGLMHDDYDYEVVNTLLEKNLRSYIKTVTCFPETVTRGAYEGFMKDLLPSEKVHINIMIHEARFQAEILYGFRAISKYMVTDW